MSTELSQAGDFLAWLHKKVRLNALSSNAKGRFVKRGDVYWCEFGLNIGSEMSKTTPRPAVIVQNYSGNKNSANTIVVPITHNDSALPCLVPITPIKNPTTQVTALDGQVNTSNIVCVSKARLLDKIGTLSAADMRKVDESLAITLGLMPYYNEQMQKYAKLTTYLEKVKQERNLAQDALKELQALHIGEPSSENEP